MASNQSFAQNIVESGQRAAARSNTSAGTETRAATFRIWRGMGASGQLKDYSTSVSEGMVVLDAIHQIQAEGATDLAVRWNCKAGKCGSCSAEINGMPRLLCMTRLSELDLEKPVTVEPMRAFPPVKDLVTDVSSNFRAKKRIRKFTPRPPDAPDGTWRMAQSDADRVQEFRKCIECFLCQDVCHVLRDHQLHEQFVGPRLLVHAAQLEMHPLDILDRTDELKESHGIGYCNITKCCTKVCPEHITITDNAIIPLKERVVDKHYDPLAKLVRLMRGSKSTDTGQGEARVKEDLKDFKLKPISKEAIPRAVQKAERYRLINQSWAAESICRDILEIDPANQQVLVMLALALTDQLAEGRSRDGHEGRARNAAAHHRSVPACLLHRHRLRAQRAGATAPGRDGKRCNGV